MGEAKRRKDKGEYPEPTEGGVADGEHTGPLNPAEGRALNKQTEKAKEQGAIIICPTCLEPGGTMERVVLHVHKGKCMGMLGQILTNFGKELKQWTESKKAEVRGAIGEAEKASAEASGIVSPADDRLVLTPGEVVEQMKGKP